MLQVYRIMLIGGGWSLLALSANNPHQNEWKLIYSMLQSILDNMREQGVIFLRLAADSYQSA